MKNEKTMPILQKLFIARKIKFLATLNKKSNKKIIIMR